MNPARTDRYRLSVERLQHGQRALREGRRLDARRYFQDAVVANPLDPRAWLELARLSSPVARAFYLVEAFDLNPTNRSTLEELRHAYREVIRLTTGVGAPTRPADNSPQPAAAPAPHVPEPSQVGSVSASPAPPKEARSLLRLVTAQVSRLAVLPPPVRAEGRRGRRLEQLRQLVAPSLHDVLRELHLAGRQLRSAAAMLARPVTRRIQRELAILIPRPARTAEDPPPRLYTLPGTGLWVTASVLGVTLLTTLSAASGWHRPAPAAIALGLARKATLATTLSATPIPTATPSPYPTVLTATPIPSATPTDTPEPLLRWAPELEVNGWTYEKGMCEGPFSGPVGSGDFIWPTDHHYLSGYNFSLRWHPGLDIAAQFGDPIYASDTGVVVFAGWNSQGYGNLVVLNHGNGWETLYAHLSQINVNCGQAVYQRNIIGYAGSTGNSSGPHLHFEILNDTNGRVNPWWYLR